MADPHRQPFIDTSIAVSRLQRGEARVRVCEWHPTRSQRLALADILSPYDLTSALTLAIERAIDAYHAEGLKKGVYSRYEAQQRPIYLERIEAALALGSLLDPMNDWKLAKDLRRAMTSWSRMADLIPRNPTNRPTDAAMIMLGVAIVRALDHQRIPLNTGRRRTVSMEVLDFVRRCADPDLPNLTVRGAYAFTRKVLATYRRSQK